MTYSQHIKSNILFSLNKLDIDFNKKITNYEVWQQVIMQNFQSVKLLSIAILILEALYTRVFFFTIPPTLIFLL